MSTTGLRVFDETIHVTNTWLKAVMERMGTDDRHRAYAALRAALHALRDALPPDEAVHLGAQLPMLIRGFYYEGWKPAASPTRSRHRTDFLDQVAQWLRDDAIDPEIAARATFLVLCEMISAGETVKVINSLPKDVRDLWPHLSRA